MEFINLGGVSLLVVIRKFCMKQMSTFRRTFIMLGRRRGVHLETLVYCAVSPVMNLNFRIKVLSPLDIEIMQAQVLKLEQQVHLFPMHHLIFIDLIPPSFPPLAPAGQPPPQLRCVA